MRAKFLLAIVGLSLGGSLAPGSVSAQETWGPSPKIGESPGVRSDGLECPAGKYAIGLQVRSGTYIHEIRLECASLGSAGEHQSIQLLNLYIGGIGGGTQRQMRCPSGKVMVGFKGREGMWIDRVQVACKPWRAELGTDGSTQWLTAAGGTGGEAYGPLTCPGRMAVYRLFGWTTSAPIVGTLVLGYNFSCKSA